MKPQHLSDEAVAAFADGVLDGFARDRAARHTAECPECAYAVAAQREAVWALRTAPAPALPSGLLQRLCEVPMTTPLNLPPTSLGPDGTTLMATFGSLTPSGAVGIVPAEPAPGRGAHRPRRPVRPIVGAAVAVAAAGVLVVSSAAHASSGTPVPAPAAPGGVGSHATVAPAGYVSGGQHH